MERVNPPLPEHQRDIGEHGESNPRFGYSGFKMVWFPFPHLLYVFAVKRVMNILFCTFQKQWLIVVFRRQQWCKVVE
jgi:hypothetical protein